MKLQNNKKGLGLNRVPDDLNFALGKDNDKLSVNNKLEQSNNVLKDFIMDLGIEWLGNIPYDPMIEEFDLQGKPLIGLPLDSLSFKAAEWIMGKLEI